MADETTFFQSGDITVTNARFIVGAQTFAMRGVTSVEGVETPVSYAAPVFIVIFGLVLALAGFSGSVFLAIVGILVIAAGVAIAIRRKATFAVVLRTAGGEITAYQSFDRAYISSIIQALNDSIISHG